jgi:hypothetical protein
MQLPTLLTNDCDCVCYCAIDIKSAPLWDSESNSYVGMITVTDFIDILRHYHQPLNRSHGTYPDIGRNKICAWRGIVSLSVSLPLSICLSRANHQSMHPSSIKPCILHPTKQPTALLIAAGGLVQKYWRINDQRHCTVRIRKTLSTMLLAR